MLWEHSKIFYPACTFVAEKPGLEKQNKTKLVEKKETNKKWVMKSFERKLIFFSFRVKVILSEENEQKML